MVRIFFLAFMKTDMLYHTAKNSVYGMWLMVELKRHGYEISPGTLCQIFHG
jgi:PadR family transcriptional regulator PadR